MARVLIIDDDARYANLVQHALELSGFEVAALTRLRGALAQMVSFRPDIVLLDVRIPECSGPEPLGQLLRSWRDAGVRFLLYSNLPLEELDALAATCGADGFVHKRGVQHVVERLHALLPQGSAVAPIAAG